MLTRALVVISLLVSIASLGQSGGDIAFENVNATKAGTDSVVLRWNSIPNISHLEVRYRKATTKYLTEEELKSLWLTKNLDPSATSCTLIGLEEGSSYLWQIGVRHARSDLDSEPVYSKDFKFKTSEGFGILQFLIIIGALCFFIYGMKIMSEGIQKLAGSRLKGILSAMTNNRFSGVFTGFFTTSLIQSSSATTVMIVSFVNAGLLSLRQAIGVIMGANIGTTMTAWLLVLFGFSKFSVAAYALPIIGLGLPMMLMRKSQVKSLGEFLVGFALLFIGLDELKHAVEALGLSDNQAFSDWITSLGSYGFGSTLLFVLIGTILTVIVQSSSAAMALTLTFVGDGLSFELAAAIVLGENIGTTITANLAAMVGNVHAKRAARAHFIFNVFGVVWMLLIFYVFLGWIADFMADTDYGSPYTGDETAVRTSLALFHTCFNIINTVLLIWFVELIARLVTRFTKSKGEDDTFTLEYIGSGSMKTPELSLLEARKEVAKFGKITAKLSGFVQQLLVEHNSKKQTNLLKKVEKYEEITDRVEVEVANYLSKVSEGNLTEETSKKVRGMLSIVNDLERIGDIYYQMSKTIERKIEEKVWFTPDQRDRLLKMMKKVDEAFEIMNNNLAGDVGQPEYDTARQKEDEINEYRNYLRSQHLESMEKGDYNVRSGMIFTEIFSQCEKVGDHVINVSEAIAGEI